MRQYYNFKKSSFCWIYTALASRSQRSSTSKQWINWFDSLKSFVSRMTTKHTPDDVDIDFPRCFTALSHSYLSPPARCSLRLRYRHSQAHNANKQ